MGDLHIALQDGFKDDAVVISVNGAQVFSKNGVTTNRVIGRADAIDSKTDSRTAAVRVEVRSRNLVGTLDVTVADSPFIAVNLSPDGGVTLMPSSQPFGYM